jgi:hypothetical protein
MENFSRRPNSFCQAKQGKYEPCCEHPQRRDIHNFLAGKGAITRDVFSLPLRMKTAENSGDTCPSHVVIWLALDQASSPRMREWASKMRLGAGTD